MFYNINIRETVYAIVQSLARIIGTILCSVTNMQNPLLDSPGQKSKKKKKPTKASQFQMK